MILNCVKLPCNINLFAHIVPSASSGSPIRHLNYLKKIYLTNLELSGKLK